MLNTAYIENRISELKAEIGRLEDSNYDEAIVNSLIQDARLKIKVLTTFVKRPAFKNNIRPDSCTGQCELSEGGGMEQCIICGWNSWVD